MIRALYRSTWTMPVLLALFTLAGLIAALTGDGTRDACAAIALALPLFFTLVAVIRRY